MGGRGPTGAGGVPGQAPARVDGQAPPRVAGAARAREQLWSPARLPLGGAEATACGGRGAARLLVRVGGAAVGGLAGQALAN